MKNYLLKNKKKILIVFSAIILLIALDQVSKLIVCNIYGINEGIPDDYTENAKGLHIYSLINDVDQAIVQNISNSTGINAGLVFVLYLSIFIIGGMAFIWAMSCVPKFFYWDTQRSTIPFVRYALFCLGVSSSVCSLIIDEVFWGGSLDWICISTMFHKPFGAPSEYKAIFLAIDFKDIYLFMAVILVIVVFAHFVYGYMRSSAQERKTFDDKVIHPIKNIKNMLASDAKSLSNMAK